MGKLVNLDSSNFKSEVLDSKGVVLVDFWAEWCGPCKMFIPILEEVASAVDSVKICKLNVDECSEIAGEYGIRSIPTLIVFKDGKRIDHMVGVRQKEELLDKIKGY